MINPFRRRMPQVREQTPPQKPQTDENCKIRYKYDKSGRVVGREISKSCTPQQIKALMESGEIKGIPKEDN